MPRNTDLKSPFVDFDYTDETSNSSSFKEAILYVARIQKVFDRLGHLELTPSVVAFLREPNIREKLESILTETTKFDLSSRDLPFLMRAELVEAYFHNRISEHLGQQEEIEVYLSNFMRETLAKPIGHELLERVRNMVRRAERSENGISKQEAQSLEDAVSQGPTREMYNAVFDGDFSVLSCLAANLSQRAYEAMSNALVVHPSQELQTTHLGGRNAIDMTLLLHAMATNREATDKEKAMYYDKLRAIFQENGNFPMAGDYGCVRLPSIKYTGLSAIEKRWINSYLLENLMDAHIIRETMVLFSNGVDSSLASRCLMEGFLRDKRAVGVKSTNEDKGEGYVFDNDPKNDLHEVAMGAQYLLGVYSSLQESALVVRSQQSYSERKRDRDNVGLFGMFGAFKVDLDKESEPIKAKNAWEYYGLKDPENQKEFYNAYLRLYGSKGFKGETDDATIDLLVKMHPDGSMTAQYGSFGDMEEEELDFFADAGLNNERGNYFRATEFVPTMDGLRQVVEKEIVKNITIVNSLKIETGGSAPIKVEDGLFYHLTQIPRTKERLAELDERIVALLPFVQQNHTDYMEMLGLEELRSRDEVTQAYYDRLMEGRVHPDHAKSPQEKIEKTNLLIALKMARDELHRALETGIESKPSNVSTYLGNTSQMLKTD